jgi:hypothetical protein
MVRAAEASRLQGQQKRGAMAMAGLVPNKVASEQARIDAAAFAEVIGEQGGMKITDQLLKFYRDNPQALKSGQDPKTAAQAAFGALEEGDISTVKMFGDMFDLPAKRAKIMGEEFDKATGRAEELARIEQEQQRKEKEFRDAQIKRMQRETEQASKDMLKLEEQREKTAEKLAEFEEQRAEKMQSAFNFQGLAEARDRLFMAAKDNQKDDLTAGKMREEISRVVDALGKLQAKWGMV